MEEDMVEVDDDRPLAIISMRHSIRADMVPHGQAIWSYEERRLRPHDSPIANFDLPRYCADRYLRCPSYQGITRVVTSPFRRCLQTAGVVCEELGITVLEVDFGLCEGMSHVRQLGTQSLDFLSLSQMKEAANTRVGGMSSSHSLSNVNIGIVTRDNQVIMDDRISDLDIEIPSLHETQDETISRFENCYNRIIQRHCNSSTNLRSVGSVLCVTHWEGVSLLINTILQMTNQQNPKEIPTRRSYSVVNECGFVALDLISRTFLDAKGVTFQ